mmetsp:Transcript_34336/g.90332  ORF Transcript_34336/g.90332 Transcript_34336/m.90332 type:complete len:214 (-) Transcript_34336:1951-2592(-)
MKNCGWGRMCTSTQTVLSRTWLDCKRYSSILLLRTRCTSTRAGTTGFTTATSTLGWQVRGLTTRCTTRGRCSRLNQKSSSFLSTWTRTTQTASCERALCTSCRLMRSPHLQRGTRSQMRCTSMLRGAHTTTKRCSPLPHCHRESSRMRVIWRYDVGHRASLDWQPSQSLNCHARSRRQVGRCKPKSSMPSGCLASTWRCGLTRARSSVSHRAR